MSSRLDHRLRDFLGRSGQDETSCLAGRLLPTLFSETAESPDRAFYWLQIPRWLGQSFGFGTSTAERRLLDDLLWMQICIFGLFRAQDDLVDGEVDDRLLPVEANRLLLEACTCAARHFDAGSPFWIVFQNAIDRTSRAIIRLDKLQRTPDRIPHCELGLYEDLSSCLQLASAGVAFASGRERDWRTAVRPAMDRLATAAQILDDLDDLRDDLADGRINYAAWYLSRPVFGSTPEATEAVVASNLATTDRLSSLLQAVRELLDEAAQILDPTVCEPAHEYLVQVSQAVAALGERFNREYRVLFS